MKRNNFFYIGTIIAFLFAFLSFSNTSLAAIDDTGSSYDPFRLELKDVDNGIEKLIITTNQSKGLRQLQNINSPDGVGLKLELEYYDAIKDETYQIVVDDQNASIGPLDYGRDYKITNTDGIKMLPSKILIKNDSLYAFSADDTIELNAKYFPTEVEGSYNRLRAGPDFELDEGATITWDYTDMNIEMNILIPIETDYVKDEEGTKYGVLSEDALRSGEEIVKNVAASISVKNDTINFDPGFGNPTNFTASYNNDSNNTSTGEQLEESEGLGFSGASGLKVLEGGLFKGISAEKDLETYLVGITNFILTFVSVISVLMLIYGGYLWIIDQGDDQQTEKAKKVITGAVVGILIIISAYTIVNTVISLEGNSSCDVSIGITNGSIQSDCRYEGQAAVTAGIGSIVGGSVAGDTGSLIGSLMGGILGGGF